MSQSHDRENEGFSNGWYIHCVAEETIRKAGSLLTCLIKGYYAPAAWAIGIADTYRILPTVECFLEEQRDEFSITAKRFY